MNIISRIIWLIGAIIITLLLLRFFFLLFDVNPLNNVVQFIYDTSKPLVTPFFGVFNYTYVPGKAGLEIPCLVAILVYTLGATLLVQLTSFSRRS